MEIPQIKQLFLKDLIDSEKIISLPTNLLYVTQIIFEDIDMGAETINTLYIESSTDNPLSIKVKYGKRENNRDNFVKSKVFTPYMLEKFLSTIKLNKEK